MTTPLVWLVEAETFSVPGRILRAFKTRAVAEVQAVALTELIRRDGSNYMALAVIPHVIIHALEAQTWTIPVAALLGHAGFILERAA